VVGITRDRALSIDGGHMWFKWNDQNCWHNLRPVGAIRAKWTILDGKVGVWSIFMFRALKVVPPPMLIKASIGLALRNKR
jgi:hypothetical protein